MKLSIEGEDIAVFVWGDQNSLLNGLVAHLFHSTLERESMNDARNGEGYDDGGDGELDDFFDFSGHCVFLLSVVLFVGTGYLLELE